MERRAEKMQKLLKKFAIQMRLYSINMSVKKVGKSADFFRKNACVFAKFHWRNSPLSKINLLNKNKKWQTK